MPASSRPTVVIADFIAGPLETERRVLGEIAEIVALDASSEEELVGKIEAADAIMMYHTVSITARTINALKNCKIIVRCGVGYDNVDWRLARAARHRRGQRARLRHRGSGRHGDRHDAGPDPGHQPVQRPAARPAGRMDVYRGPAGLAAARPGVRHRRPGPDRQGRGLAGQSPGHGRRVLRSLRARRPRQVAGRAPRGNARRPAGRVARRQHALPLHGRDVPHDRRRRRWPRCVPARSW